MGIRDIFKKIQKEKKVIEGDATKNKHFSSQNDFPDPETTRREFERSKKKLFEVDRWSRLPGITCTFELHNERGERAEGEKPQVGYYLKILLPGFMPENWVKIISVKEEENMAEFVVSPSTDPTEKGSKEIKHFFIDEATSTFRVRRRANSIFGYEIGKEEGINNEGEEAGKRELINTLIAEGGWAGLQDLQWKKFTDYVVHHIEVED